MRAVTWLHISDFHFCENEGWSQNVVLSSMLEDITRRCKNGLMVDFILATGDFAFSGKESEYDLVAAFLGELSTTVNLPSHMIYCVPGNHDVQRDRYKTLFSGARQLLQNENDVYAFLADKEERRSLLLRQKEFSKFQNRIFAMQERQQTADGLGYVSVLEIEDLRIAIIGLNSAWLSEGGDSDERQLVLGENQVIDAIDIAVSAAPHIIVGMQHHPFDYLKRFDQQATQRRLEEACHFFHCGHLHQPDATQAVTQSGKCLALSAGASFESRTFHNSYSVITLYPLHAKSEVTFVQYKPSEGVFSYESYRNYTHEIGTPANCSTRELAISIEQYCQATSDISHYLASLLLGDVTDVPIPTDGTVVFGSPALLSKQSNSELMEATHEALAVGRAIRLLYGSKPMDEILIDHGAPLQTYAELLQVLATTNNVLQEQLKMRSTVTANLTEGEDKTPFHYTLNRFDDLIAQEDWEGLRELAERCCKLDNAVVAASGKRALALYFARSTERDDRLRAIRLYRELTQTEYCEADDWAALATIMINEGKHKKAKAAVQHGIHQFPGKIKGFAEVGMKIVEATGDIEFREQLRMQLEDKEK